MHDLLERLAELEHEQWMAWAKRIMETEPISEERRQRWQRYMVPYAELPEEVKEQDREWARKVLEVIGTGILTSYIEAAMRRAITKQLSNGDFYAKIPECPGVWAARPSRERVLQELREVLEEWLVLKLKDGDTDLPILDGIDLNTIGLAQYQAQKEG